MLGILMLDTVFPRPVGDIGNPLSFPFATRYLKVDKASPEKVIFDRANGLVDSFIEGARQLEAEGCKAIVTSCGFLALQHHQIAAAVRIPFASSSLCWLPTLYNAFGGAAHVGILTASARSLSAEHLRNLGGDPATPAAGMPEDSEFARVIIGNTPQGDMQAVRAEIIATAESFVTQQPQLRALILECTNMSPYAADIAQRTGRPVFDLVGLAKQMMRLN
jgi:aspartate/glutamate racemase